MTTTKDLFAKYPQSLRNRSKDPSATFELMDDRYVVHRSGSEPEVVKGVSDLEERSGTSIGPVYAITPSGGTAIPTGLIFVRFKNGVNAADQKSEIAAAGYEVAEAMDYAPEAVWLRHSSGDIGKALNGIMKLEKLKGVENIEPQMLMQRTSR